MTTTVELTPEELAAKAPSELVEWLVARAEEARTASMRADGDFLRSLRDRVRRASELATGPQLDLLDVTKAYIRTLGRTELGPREQALRAFRRDLGERADSVLDRWLRFEPIADGEVEGSLRTALERLVQAGIADHSNTRGWALRQDARSLVLDLVEPLPFRMWRRVQEARGRIEALEMNRAGAKEHLAAFLGVDEDQAHRFLVREPIASATLSLDTSMKQEAKLLYRAPAWRNPSARDAAVTKSESQRSTSSGALQSSVVPNGSKNQPKPERDKWGVIDPLVAPRSQVVAA